MLKPNIIRKLALLAIPALGVTLLGGCSNMGASTPKAAVDLNNKATHYVYKHSNGRMYYQDSNGRYYYEGRDGRYYYGTYHVVKRGNHYYRYYYYYPEMNGHYISNNQLSIKVRSAILNDPLLRSQMITVRHDGHGRIELLGRVDNDAQKQRATNIARSVPGVRYVDDDLRVGLGR